MNGRYYIFIFLFYIFIFLLGRIELFPSKVNSNIIPAEIGPKENKVTQFTRKYDFTFVLLAISNLYFSERK